ncbi:MAG: sugar phosphate isomerase/epimerase family protein [Chloroflexota bacterium]
MDISMATDYAPDIHGIRSKEDYFTGIGNPEIYLQRIAEAGFKYLHWCHHWRSDFLYQAPELAHIETLLKQYDLQILDIHGSEGIEKFWYSPQEYARLAGVELVKNRIEFAAHFGADAVVMHVYPFSFEPEINDLLWTQLQKTLDTLEPYCRQLGVKLAIENLFDALALRFDQASVHTLQDNRGVLQRIFDRYPPDTIGLCWDTGHGHIGYDRLEMLAEHKNRLIVLHLHDNDSEGDQHRLIFGGSIDWEQTADLIAESPYDKPLTLEVVMQEQFETEADFLQEAYKTGMTFAQMVQNKSS